MTIPIYYCFIIFIVGEPLPTAAWEWYYQNVGKKKCVVIDTYWQTGISHHIMYVHIYIYIIFYILELGGIVLSPQPGDSMVKSGACSRPFFGVEPVIVDEKVLSFIKDCVGDVFVCACIPRERSSRRREFKVYCVSKTQFLEWVDGLLVKLV